MALGFCRGPGFLTRLLSLLHKAGAPTGAWVGLEGVCLRLGGMVRSLDRLRALSLEKTSLAPNTWWFFVCQNS